jgi:hypothetical protein
VCEVAALQDLGSEAPDCRVVYEADLHPKSNLARTLDALLLERTQAPSTLAASEGALAAGAALGAFCIDSRNETDFA